MTITLAVVYAPIGFQGGLTGSLFLEFAITLAAAVIVSGIVAITLSPVMSSRFVHAHGEEGRLDACSSIAASTRARRPTGACSTTRSRCGARSSSAALLVTLAAWPLYMFSRQELAPVEDQSHISLFYEAAPDSRAGRDEPATSLKVVRALTPFPEAEYMWSLTEAWGGFGGMVMKDWRERERSTEEMYGEVYGAVSQVPGLRVFPRLDPPLPTPGQYDVETGAAERRAPQQMLETTGAVLDAGWKSGKFLYVDTDLKIDLPEARVVLDREQIADLGLDLASVGRELGTLLGGNYVNRFNFFDRSYKVIPQIGDDGPRHARAAARSQDQDAGWAAGAGVDVRARRDEHRAAHAQPLPAAQLGAHLRRRESRRDEGGRRCACWRTPPPRRAARTSRRLRRRVAADPPRRRGADRHARVLGRADLPGARGAVQQLPRSADRAARLRAARDLRRAALQLPGPHDDQHLLAGGADHARRA